MAPMYAGGSLKSPDVPNTNILTIENFKGVDLYNSPANVENYRSPEAPNMIRDVPGKVRKRLGYHKREQYDARINGVYFLREDSGTVKKLVHAGTKLYLDGNVIYEGMADNRGKSWQVNGRLYLLDGKKYLCCGEFEDEETHIKSYQVKAVEEIGYVPVITISRAPNGGGTQLNPPNLLSDKWTDSFLGTADAKEYQLSFDNLDETKVTAKKMKADGTWENMTEGSGFSVNRTTGKVTFTTAPGASPITGADNLEITASKKRGKFESVTEEFDGAAGQKEFVLARNTLDGEKVVVKTLKADGTWNTYTEPAGMTVDRAAGKVTMSSAPGTTPAAGKKNVQITYRYLSEPNADKINKCLVSILFGVNGAADRLFVTGNGKYKNYDWYSQLNDPTYFGDIWYSTLGQDSSGIVGYSIINDMLAAHKDEGEDGRNIILRNGILSNDKAAFPIANTIQGQGAVGRYNFAYLNEPLFVTKLGVYAVTAQDVTGDKYAQSRSFYINRALQEEDLEHSYALAYRDFYLLACRDRVYVLDGLQKTYEKNMPYSAFQYECYYWDNIGARILYEENDTLCFGTEKGEIMEFYRDTQKQQSYNDNGRAIPCRWDLPDLDGKLFYKNKTFRRISVRLASAIATGVSIYVQKRGIWSRLFDAGARARYFDFSYVEFSKINFSSDATPRTLGSKIRVKKADKARFSMRNDALNEPFGIYSIGLEYTESGNYKG